LVYCTGVPVDEWRTDVASQLLEVLVVPRRIDALVDRGSIAVAVPADSEAVPVGRMRAELRMEALVDQRVLGLVQQVLER
jgi:hypothetical protein